MTTAPHPSPRPHRIAVVLLLAAAAGTIAGCSPAAEQPAATATATAGAVTESPAPAPTGTPVTATDVPADVMLTAEVLDVAPEPFAESTAVEPWRIPDACGEVAAPAGATAMRTHAHGDGMLETVVGVQQVAAFATADDAVAATTALVEALGTCTDTTGSGTTYGLEPVAVGAQGHGLATWYYGAAGGDGDTGQGTYLAVTRRGSAVTLVSGEGGERTVGQARAETVAQAQQAWERLCGYEVAGC